MNASDPRSAATDPINRVRRRDESRLLRVLRREGALSAKSISEFLRTDEAAVDGMLTVLQLVRPA